QQSVRPLEHNAMTEEDLRNYDLLPAKDDSSVTPRPSSGPGSQPKNNKAKIVKNNKNKIN
ncbi:MAG TPA: hypothetical protein VNW04_14015, partial [Puia sp.]|nr:hypothetical protein [Puia sp.]